MGYTTKFDGELKFSTPINDKQICALVDILGEDCRDHDGWVEPGSYMSYIDLEFVNPEEPTGICWDGSEKTYEMARCVNLVTRLMRERWPDFKLTGFLSAQGEEVGDVWVLKMDEQGIAHEVKGKVVPA